MVLPNMLAPSRSSLLKYCSPTKAWLLKTVGKGNVEIFFGYRILNNACHCLIYLAGQMA